LEATRSGIKDILPNSFKREIDRGGGAGRFKTFYRAVIATTTLQPFANNPMGV